MQFWDLPSAHQFGTCSISGYNLEKEKVNPKHFQGFAQSKILGLVIYQ